MIERKMNKSNLANRYNTNDIYLSAFLIASGNSKLVGIQDQASGRKVFEFEPPPSPEVILKFYSGEQKVSALRLLEALQSLKAATYVVNTK